MSKRRYIRLRENEEEGAPEGGPSVVEVAIEDGTEVEAQLGESDGVKPERKKLKLIPRSPHAKVQESTAAPLTFTGTIRESPGSVWEVVLIRAGWSKNNRYYPADVLGRSASLFENAPISLYGFDPATERNHVPSQWRDSAQGLVANIAGWVTGVREAMVDGVMALVGNFQIADAQVANLLARMPEGRDVLGLSIDAIGQSQIGHAEGRRGHLVTSIDHVYEITIVDRPAAGGKFLRMIASEENGETRMNKKKLMTFLLKFGQKAGLAPAAVTSMTESELAVNSATVLKEMNAETVVISLAMDFIADGKTDEAMAALAKLADRAGEPEAEVVEAGLGAPAVVVESVTELQPFDTNLSESRRVLEEVKVERAALRLDRMLESSQLSEKAQEVIRKKFEGRYFEEQELQQEIDNYRSVLAEHTAPSGPLQESTRASIEFDENDKWKMECDLLFGYKPEEDRNLQESDRARYRSLGPCYSIRRWFERGPSVLTESVSADFPNILGTSMNRAMVQMFADSPRYFDDIIYIKPGGVSDFKTQTRLIHHGFAGIPIVQESASYQSAGFPGEGKSEYAVDTRGVVVNITRRMMRNDDLRAFQDIPKKLAQGCRYEENLFRGRMLLGQLNALDAARNTDLAWDGNPIYSVMHGNLRTNAMSKGEIFLARLNLQNQREFAAGSTTVGVGGIDNQAGTTTLPVASTEGIFVGDMIQVESEVMKVDAVPSATSLTVSREEDGTTAAAHTAGKKVWKLGRPIPSRAHHLYFPSELEDTAWTALNSVLLPGSPNNDANIVAAKAKEGQILPHAVPRYFLGYDPASWFMGNDQRDHACFEMAYLDGRETPEILRMDAPTDAIPFDRDVHPYKCRFEFGGTNTDFRGVHANFV